MFGSKYKYLWYNAHKKQDIRTLPIFADCAKKVIEDERTYLGYDRLYTLHQLLYQLKEGKDVVEIGVFRGGSSFFMADVLKQLGKNNKIFSCAKKAVDDFIEKNKKYIFLHLISGQGG